MPTTSKPPPPGSSGLPLLGETLEFAKDVFAFIHTRRERHGDIFRTSILGNATVFLVGPKRAATWLDTNSIERAGGMPSNLLQLFGGNPDIVPLLDGDAHHKRKQGLLAAFSREAIASYLPLLQERMQSLLSRWAQAREGAVTADLKTLAIESIATAVFGLSPGAEMNRLLEDNAILAKAFTALPIDLPGTTYRKGLAARSRILALLETIVQRHIDRVAFRASENAASDLPSDGLSRILQSAQKSGAPLDAKTAAREMHHFLLAGMIVYAELAAILRSLHDYPAVRERARAEVQAQAKAGEIGPMQLRQMPYLAQVIDEVKRTCPNVPMSFGRARTTFEVDGYTVAQGTLVMMAVFESNLDAIFTEPQRFDPDRFSPERDEKKRSPHAFMPQGAGELSGHKCAGYEFSTVMMELFAALLLRGPEWELPPQDLELRWVVPPEYKSGLVVRWPTAG